MTVANTYLLPGASSGCCTTFRPFCLATTGRCPLHGGCTSIRFQLRHENLEIWTIYVSRAATVSTYETIRKPWAETKFRVVLPMGMLLLKSAMVVMSAQSISSDSSRSALYMKLSSSSSVDPYTVALLVLSTRK